MEPTSTEQQGLSFLLKEITRQQHSNLEVYKRFISGV